MRCRAPDLPSARYAAAVAVPAAIVRAVNVQRGAE